MKVLLVDDEVELVTAIVERMQLRGLEAEGVTDGQEALRRVRESAFDVVVLDLKMPGMSGLETLAALKRERPALPVILMTGHAASVDGEEGLAAGARDYCVKPVQLDELIEKIQRAAAGEGHPHD